MSAGKERGVCVRAKMIKTPEMERGITSMTIRALRNEENCSTMVMMIRRKERSMACRMEFTEF